MSHYELDVRNLLCPLPLIKAQSKVKDLQSEDELEIICTDPTTLSDIPAWCKIKNYQVLSIEREKDEIRIIIKLPQIEKK